MNMKVDRSNIKIITGNKISANDSCRYLSKPELLEAVWEITRDVWSFIEGEDAERRLQRDVTALNRRKS